MAYLTDISEIVERYPGKFSRVSLRGEGITVSVLLKRRQVLLMTRNGAPVSSVRAVWLAVVEELITDFVPLADRSAV